jgi:hypothetical protein
MTSRFFGFCTKRHIIGPASSQVPAFLQSGTEEALQAASTCSLSRIALENESLIKDVRFGQDETSIIISSCHMSWFSTTGYDVREDKPNGNGRDGRASVHATL